MDFGPLHPGLPGRLLTADGRLHLCPPVMLADLPPERLSAGTSLFGTVQQHWQGRGAREVLAGAKETEADALPMLERRASAK